MMASATFARLQMDPTFKAQLEPARAEMAKPGLVAGPAEMKNLAFVYRKYA